MTKGAALQAFFSGFGMTAYTATSVPEDAVFPYLTYELITSAWDGGYIWLKRGSPWCQSLSDETSPTIKRRYINVTAEYLTEN